MAEWTGRTGRTGTVPIVGLLAWTLYVWGTRIRNAAGDATLSSGSRAFSIVLSVSFVVLAIAGIVVVVRAWARPFAEAEVLVLRALAAWTVVVWLVRMPMIALDGHSVGFKVVHIVLGLISIGLSALVWRSLSRATVDAPG